MNELEITTLLPALKALIVKECDKDFAPESIDDNERLIGGRLELDSLDALQISMGLEPDQPSVRFLLALARLGQRRVDEARALLKQVPPADPYFKLAQERLKQLEPLRR